MAIALRNYALIIACALSLQLAAVETAQLSAENTIVCFDLHDVILKRNTAQRRKIGFKNIPLTLRLAINKFSTKKKFYNGEQYALDLKENGLDELAGLVRQMSAAYVINRDVLAVIKDLKAKGFQIYLASNIGADHLQDLSNPERLGSRTVSKEQADIRDMLVLLDKLVSVDYTAQPIIAKPNPVYFENLKEICKQKYGEYTQIVFIDDNARNVQAASKCGLHTIRFASAKALHQDLEKLHIL
jgi:FMN phosphatase YigB (HAD superfamily)